ncbi:Zinc knuckle domain protein [Mycena sanguinolenta]|uniref:Zinc knuckle domain protein n=1 Tax=Mycena sanguinolenta TaxID=230812 RepID=A0A8H6Y6Q6_9AGAR|nr:Zinc knuckle domain protein [Mycena sanguinolenta]
MAYQFSRKGCFKCGNLGHIAESCSSDQRLCYNCRQPGHESSACPSPRTVSAKQCYSCGGVGHIQGLFTRLFWNSELTLRSSGMPKLEDSAAGGRWRPEVLRWRRIVAVSDTLRVLAPVVPSAVLPLHRVLPPPGRALNTSTLPPVKCYRCGGPNHMARDCLATIDTAIPTAPASMKNKTCYKCQQEGHIARECPENADFMG